MEANITVGSIYRMSMDEEQDVTPKDGMKFRPKYFIIIGSAEYGYYIAYVLINKSINKNYIYTKELLDCQYPLSTKDYPRIFKINPSYVNLARIREIELTKLVANAEFCGELTVKDLPLILDSIRNSRVITTKEKRRYGLL
jgi:hypothetical protein